MQKDPGAAGFWLFVGLIHVIAAVVAAAEPGPWTWESTVLAGLIVASALGVLIAWWREGIGGTIIVICAIAHSTFATIASGHNKGFAMLITGSPLLVAGILFLASWWRSERSSQDLHPGRAF
jgi:hypothetical protein